METTYPTDMQVPSRKIIKSFYEAAIRIQGSYQTRLDELGSGMLSLEEVLIPAVVMQETDALKHLQAKAQRDASEEAVEALKECRRAIYEAAESSIRSVREARVMREEEQVERDRAWEEERRHMKEQRRLEKEEAKRIRREERSKAKALKKERTRLDMKKKLPKNMELWREVAFLMTELTNLQKEERMWKEAERRLTEKEIEVSEKEQSKQEEIDDEDAVDIGPNVLKEKVDMAVSDILLSSVRVNRAVELVAGVVTESDETRKELYNKYRKDFQFHGYKGVNNNKGLLRALSQD
jgi:hypothetical protein